MYPDEAVLVEVGRIAIAAGRLDAELGSLWWHLAPDKVSELRARKAAAGEVRDRIRALAAERLDEANCAAMQAFVEAVRAVQKRRNEVMHSRWLLRGRDAMRPVSEFMGLDESERASYLVEWDREARSSTGWQRQPNDSLELGPPHASEDLIQLERELANVTEVANQWCFRIASMRESGSPPGWKGPAEARRGPPPLAGGAVVGPDALQAMSEYLSIMRERSKARTGQRVAGGPRDDQSKG